MPKMLVSSLFLFFCIQNALAQVPVILSAPVPAIAAHYAVGSTRTVIYTVTNNVPNQSFPLSIAGISAPISRVSVANDCGKSIPRGPSTCQLGLQIAPASAGKVNQVLKVNYEGRAPLTSKIGFTSVPPATLIYINAKIETIDSHLSTAQSVAITGSQITGVGSNDAMLEQFQGPATIVSNLNGTTILPGFIATHQHALGWGAFTDRNWVDVSSVNVLLKPPVDDARCIVKTDYQSCFIPVQTQADVNARIQDAIVNAATIDAPIYGFNYDPSRLGHGANCDPVDGVAFQCDNFENGQARATLDAMSATHPILIASESGHITYVNTAYLRILNICGTDVEGPNCIMPIYNIDEEKAMANLGQLNEDLSMYAEENAGLAISTADPLSGAVILKKAIDVMQQHGFTLIQEGAANKGLMELWAEASRLPDFPAKVALFALEPSETTVNLAVNEALEVQANNKNNPNVFIAAIKMLADGSIQGYSGFMSMPYFTLYAPFTDPGIFAQPYLGLFDSNQAAITAGAETAHRAHFPLAVHQNGDVAIQNAINGIKAAGAPPPGVRDMLVHFSLASEADVDAALEMGVGSTFLMENIYYYGLPMCQQVIGESRARGLYPAGMAARKGLRFGLHSDTPVTPPDPLFAIWVAKTRTTQQPSWYPNQDLSTCPVVMAPNESISIAQGIKAFTIDGAWTYGLDKEMGSIEVGKEANFVFLSADPLSMENTPNELKNIHVLATMYRGRYHANPHALEAPIWPE